MSSLDKRLKKLKIFRSVNQKEIRRGWYNYDLIITNLKSRIDQKKSIHLSEIENKKISIAKAILMYLEDYDVAEIVKETHISKSSIYNYINRYTDDKYFMFKMFGKPKQTIPKIAKYESLIILNLEAHNIKTLKQAQEWIQELTGISLSLSRIYAFFDKHNIKKINGTYRQKDLDCDERKKMEYIFLENHTEIVRKWVNDNHLLYSWGLATKIRKEFGIRYTSEYHLREWIRRNHLSIK